MLTHQKNPLNITEAEKATSLNGEEFLETVQAEKAVSLNEEEPLDTIKVKKARSLNEQDPLNTIQAKKARSLKKKVAPITLTPKEKLIQEERMRDVILLLKQLVEREEVTLKLVIDCLYDVGLINLVNKRIRNKTLNRTLKAIAVMPKPLFRLVALRWLKKNLPKLLATWLEGKVSFK